MNLDPLLLSRLQFFWVIAWHILLPALTVGLASYIALLEGLQFFGDRPLYARLSAFWTRIFAISFSMGVVSGVVMPFQFGTNWSRFSDATANILSPLLAYEGFSAFALEATFLSILLFARQLVPRWVHFSAALIVALGTLLSSFWILAANSWMQTPAGYVLREGRFFPVDWWSIVFTPRFPYAFAHTIVAFYITTGFVVVGVGAYLVRRKRFAAEGRAMMSMTLWLLAVLVPMQMLIGDAHGLNTLKYQPAKVAAIEANWTPQREAPLVLFAWPDAERQTNSYAVEIPRLASLILTHHQNGLVPGLRQWPRDERPPVAIVFFAFRAMVGIGVLMLAMIAASLVLRARKQLFDTTWFLRLCIVMAPLGFVAVIAGWVTAEVGRQPWTVYGVMRTAASVTPALTGTDVLTSLLAYIAVYLILFPAGIYAMARIVVAGPTAPQLRARTVEAGRAKPQAAAAKDATHGR